MPEKDITSTSGRFDKEALVALIDSRFNANIKEWYQLYWQPMHLENKAELSAIKGIVTNIVAKMNQAEGGLYMAKSGMTLAEKILAAAGFLAAFVIGHLWK